MMLVEDVKNFALLCGGFIERYNPSPFVTNNIEDSEFARNAVLSAHKQRHRLYDEMHGLDPNTPTDRVKLRECASRMEEIEFQIQKAWGFELDRNYHSYWFQVPHCTCPKYDNEDNIGTDYRIISENCPVHSD